MLSEQAEVLSYLERTCFVLHSHDLYASIKRQQDGSLVVCIALGVVQTNFVEVFATNPAAILGGICFVWTQFWQGVESHGAIAENTRLAGAREQEDLLDTRQRAGSST